MDSEKEKQNGGYSVGFVPQRLKIGNNEPTNFPFNVLFMSWKTVEGEPVSGSALYEPDLATFKQDGEKRILEYRNIYGGDCWLRITYDEKKKNWMGEKFVNGKSAGMAFGAQWDGFFVHFTMLGLSNGERCLFEKLGGAPPSKMKKENEEYKIFCDNCGKVAAAVIFYPEGESEDDPRPTLKISGSVCNTTTYYFNGADLTKESLLYIATLLKQKKFKELNKMDHGVFGFFCYECGKNYCPDCWKDITPIFDEGFYDYTLATCPVGHRQEIND